MLIHPWDAGDEADGWAFVAAQGFGHLVAAGRGRDVPVVVPTQYVLDEAGGGGERPDVLLHLARPNPLWRAVEENPAVLLAVAGEWAYIPSAWKAIGDEDPALGIPTTYYAAVQLVGRAEVLTEPAQILAVLRAQLAALEPDIAHADPQVHTGELGGIRAMRISVGEVRTKFKYGGNVDREHRRAIATLLADRDGPGDATARARVLRSL